MQALSKNPILLAAPVQATLSQQRLLERLHYVSSFSEQVVILHGPQGAGKSTLAELYLEQASDYAEVAFLSASAKQSDAHLRSQILTQLYGTMPVSSKALGEQMANHRAISHAIVVVDNAEYLSNAFIHELQQAIMQMLASGKGCRLSVMLSGISSWAKQFKAIHNGEQTPLLMAVEPFTFAEQYDFVRAMLPQALQSSWTQQRHKRELLSLTGFPGEIQTYLQQNLRPQAFDLGDGIDSLRDNDSTSIDDEDEGVAVALGAYSARKRKLNKPQPGWFKLLMLPLLGSLFTLVILNNDLTTAPIKLALADNHRLDPLFWQTPLPKPVPAVPTEVATASDPVNSADELPAELAITYDDALTDLKTAAEREASTETLNVKLSKPSKASVAAEQTAPAPTSAAETAAEGTSQRAPVSKNNSYDNAWALAQPPRNYTLQLNSLSSAEWLDNFLQESGLQNTARTYQYGSGNNLRLITIYGSFSTIDAARNAVAELPPQVQALQPWPKSFAAVHANIEQQP
ncbi:MAG: AAA family ATPase [Idiomarina sp.]